MRNYNVYLQGMEKALDEKLFFVKQIDLYQFDRIIDFGCGGGNILAALASLQLPAQLIGIDHDPHMLNATLLRVPTATVKTSLNRDMLDEKTLIIFSSVLHEIGNDWNELSLMLEGTGCTIVVRDMRYSAPNPYLSHDILSKIIRYSNPAMLADFVKKYGMASERDAYHYLLKYSYVDNWELELEENYFSFDYGKLFILGKTMYEYNYVLPYKRRRVLDDFDILLTKPTHTQIILKVRKE